VPLPVRVSLTSTGPSRSELEIQGSREFAVVDSRVSSLLEGLHPSILVFFSGSSQCTTLFRSVVHVVGVPDSHWKRNIVSSCLPIFTPFNLHLDVDIAESPYSGQKDCNKTGKLITLRPIEGMPRLSHFA
jgi:hypothetical protein